MAKKPDTTHNGTYAKSEDRPAPGWKQCHECQGWVKGIKTLECPECHTTFVFKTKGAKHKDVDIAALADLLKKAGGISKVKEVLTGLQPLMEMCGSLDALQDEVDKLEAMRSLFA